MICIASSATGVWRDTAYCSSSSIAISIQIDRVAGMSIGRAAPVIAAIVVIGGTVSVFAEVEAG